MALVLKDRVRDTSTTTGTGTYTLANSAPSGYQTFGTAIGNANTCYYVAAMGADWEVGIGTYTASGTTLARTTILASSNSGSAVNWAAGTKDVWVDYPAGKAVYLDASGNATFGNTATVTSTLFPLALLDISGASAGQIKFPATQNASSNANTLDDYERGSFTPSLLFGGGSTGMTYGATRDAAYVKVGQLIFASVNFNITAKGSSTGIATISGLPYTTTTGPSAGMISYSGMAGAVTGMSGLTFTIGLDVNGTSFRLYQGASNGFTNLTDASFSNTSAFRCSAVYYAA